jgi:hypothetical protein
LAVLLCALVLAPVAHGQDSAIEAHANPGIVIGGKVGASLGAPFNELGNSPSFELELGYLLPMPRPIHHAFELFVDGGYSAPGSSGVSSKADPRLPGDGKLHYTLQHHILSVSAGLLFRVPLPTRLLAPYASLAWRGLAIDTRVTGNAGGEPFGATNERGFVHGLVFAGGLDIFLGPGALFGELQLGYAPRDAYIVQDTNLSALVLMVGYRLMLGSAAHHASESVEPAPVVAPPPAAAPPADPVPATPPQEIEPPPPAATSDGAAPAGQAPGQIRGNVRSFEGKSVVASILVNPIKAKATTDATGAFALDVPPGKYTIHVRAHGYKSQDRTVVVAENGVTVLNIELGKKK